MRKFISVKHLFSAGELAAVRIIGVSARREFFLHYFRKSAAPNSEKKLETSGIFMLGMLDSLRSLIVLAGRWFPMTTVVQSQTILVISVLNMGTQSSHSAKFLE